MNNLSEKEDDDNENLLNTVNCKYRDISYFSNFDVELKSKNSLSKNFDNFNHLTNELKLKFDILGISESRISKSQALNTNVSLQNYVLNKPQLKYTFLQKLS